MAMEMHPETAVHYETARQQSHGNTPPVQYRPEDGFATIAGLGKATTH
jgi:hypothetical protein